MPTYPYTRSTGKKLTYVVEITASRYAISVFDGDGKVLKNALRPSLYGSSVISEDHATMTFAASDIEQLLGMDEE